MAGLSRQDTPGADRYQRPHCGGDRRGSAHCGTRASNASSPSARAEEAILATVKAGSSERSSEELKKELERHR